MQGHQIKGFVTPTDKRTQPDFADERKQERRLRDQDAAFLRHFAMCQDAGMVPGVPAKIRLIG